MSVSDSSSQGHASNNIDMPNLWAGLASDVSCKPRVLTAKPSAPVTLGLRTLEVS